jgi:hypothetical protein
MQLRALAVFASLVALATPAAFAQETGGEPLASAPPPGLSLTGQWSLDPAASDDPGQKVKEARKGVRTDDTGPVREPIGPSPPRMPGDPGGTGRPGDPGAGGPPTGPGVDVMTPGVTGVGESGDPFGRGSSGSSSSAARAAYAFVLDLPKTLTIAQRPSLILIQEDDDEGRVRGLHPDGTRHQAPGGKSATRTRWEKGRLHVETWRPDGVDVDEVFALAPDGALLTVTVHVTEGGTSMTLERVFRHAES